MHAFCENAYPVGQKRIGTDIGHGTLARIESD
jgi:hypothetical protein